MNYIDEIAMLIAVTAEERDAAPDLSLYRIYAVLALAKGTETTNEDVHNAWAAWRSETAPDHRSLVPFDQLSPETQELDTPYTLAIRQVAAQLHNDKRR